MNGDVNRPLPDGSDAAGEGSPGHIAEVPEVPEVPDGRPNPGDRATAAP